MAYNKVSSYETQVTGDTHRGSVVYRGTEIVAWDEKTIRLATGGWYSVTTKRKMNQASHQFSLGFSVFQKAGDWFVALPTTPAMPYGNAPSSPWKHIIAR